MFDHCRHAGDSIAIFIRAWLTLVRDVQPPYHLTHWPNAAPQGTARGHGPSRVAIVFSTEKDDAVPGGNFYRKSGIQDVQLA